MILKMWNIYIKCNLNPHAKFTKCSESTESWDILSWNISQMITETIPISPRIVISYAMKRSISCFDFDGKSMETETTTWSKFTNVREVIVEQILASEERNKPKKVGRWESHLGVRVAKLTIWVRSFEIKIITEFTRSISSSIGWSVYMTDVNIFKDKDIRWWVNERTSPMLELKSKTVHKDEEGEGKKSKTLREVKPVAEFSRDKSHEKESPFVTWTARPCIWVTIFLD